jgi:hypothetical protein|tara:strand:- start:1125 stop:1955 length:831 start_codon:yes stop_codon:yes gene_type:complete
MPLVSPIDIAVLSSPVPLPGESGTVSPGSFGVNTQQNFSAMTRGSGVTSPIGTGNQMMPVSTPSDEAQASGSITGAALESGGANVGGVVQQAPKDDFTTKVEFATYADQQADMADKALQAQTDEYMAAYKEGDTSQQTQDGKSGKTDVERVGDAIIEGATDKIKAYDTALESGIVGDEYKAAKEGIKKAADKLGVTDKLDEFKAYRQQKKEEREKGMSGARRVKRADRRADRKARKSLSGSEKRAMRKAQRKQRRAAFKQFKEDRDYEASLAAAQL